METVRNTRPARAGQIGFTRWLIPNWPAERRQLKGCAETRGASGDTGPALVTRHVAAQGFWPRARASRNSRRATFPSSMAVVSDPRLGLARQGSKPEGRRREAAPFTRARSRRETHKSGKTKSARSSGLDTGASGGRAKFRRPISPFAVPRPTDRVRPRVLPPSWWFRSRTLVSTV
jgi:hypothetical protein